jgi:hypothetical protein
VAPLSALAGYVYTGHSLGLTGTILVAVTVLLRVAYMFWRRRGRR